ncbi:abl interactor 1-like [Acropora palmata]|uniref:abl interactor 1-like n=1 Tax=Acropora palmata TaxID=6131 RepID=UPI003DA18B9D
MADVDTSIVSLIDKEIPEGRQALKDGHENLAKVAAYCEQKYLETNTRHKSGSNRAKALEETREVLEETKRFATQSLASVAYQINALALNMLGLLDQQVMKLQDMESKINHIAETVDIHKEKVARREIGVLAATKPTGRAHRIIAPAEQEKVIRYTRRATDYSILDNLGHGVKTSDRLDHRHRSSKKLKSQQSQTNKGTSRPVPGTGTTRRTPHVKPPPPPVPPPMPPSVPTDGEFPVPPLPVSQPEVPQPPSFVDGIPPPAPPPPGFPSPPPSSDIVPPTPSPVPPTPPPPPPPPGPMMSPPPPPPLPNIGGSPSPSDGTYESVIDALSPFPPPPPPDAEDLYQSPSSLPMPAPPEDMYQTPPPPMDEPPWAPENYIEKVVSLYEYTQQRDDELTFPEGVIIYVIKKNDDGWFEGVSEGGKTGLFPGNYVEVCL